MFDRILRSLRSLGWDRFTHQSEQLYEFRRSAMSTLHRVVKAISGEKPEDYANFEEAILLEMRPAVEGRTVLETGCGPGGDAERFLNEFGAQKIIATDISLGMLLAARNRCPALLLVQADARHLPFVEGFADVVYSNCMYHRIEVQGRGSVLRQSLRVGRRVVFVKEIAGFSSRLFDTIYRFYYSVVDGSAYRPTVEEWLKFLAPYVVRHIRRPEHSVVFRYVFFELDPSRKKASSD